MELSGDGKAANAASVLSVLGGGDRAVGSNVLQLLNSWQDSVMAAGGGPAQGLIGNNSDEDPLQWQRRILAVQPHIEGAFSEALSRGSLQQVGLIEEGASEQELLQAQRRLLVQMHRRWCQCGEDRASFMAPGEKEHLQAQRQERKRKKKSALVRLFHARSALVCLPLLPPAAAAASCSCRTLMLPVMPTPCRDVPTRADSMLNCLDCLLWPAGRGGGGSCQDAAGGGGGGRCCCTGSWAARRSPQAAHQAQLQLILWWCTASITLIAQPDLLAAAIVPAGCKPASASAAAATGPPLQRRAAAAAFMPWQVTISKADPPARPPY